MCVKGAKGGKEFGVKLDDPSGADLKDLLFGKGQPIPQHISRALRKRLGSGRGFTCGIDCVVGIVTKISKLKFSGNDLVSQLGEDDTDFWVENTLDGEDEEATA
jgi:hypothetical protein